jgi:hypothetical protein
MVDKDRIKGSAKNVGGKSQRSNRQGDWRIGPSFFFVLRSALTETVSASADAAITIARGIAGSNLR